MKEQTRRTGVFIFAILIIILGIANISEIGLAVVLIGFGVLMILSEIK